MSRKKDINMFLFMLLTAPPPQFFFHLHSRINNIFLIILVIQMKFLHELFRQYHSFIFVKYSHMFTLNFQEKQLCSYVKEPRVRTQKILSFMDSLCRS